MLNSEQNVEQFASLSAGCASQQQRNTCLPAGRELPKPINKNKKS
jgi:hypothetical protein